MFIFLGFKTNKTELNAVFDIFDRGNRDFIEYQEFMEAMKQKRHVSTNTPHGWTNKYKMIQFLTRNWVNNPDFGRKVSVLRNAIPEQNTLHYLFYKVWIRARKLPKESVTHFVKDSNWIVRGYNPHLQPWLDFRHRHVAG